MLAQLPRKPVFPEHLIARVRAKIENDVESQVIPVSAGIYSQQKLKEKISAIPKPILVDYEDPIFYELAAVHNMPLKSSKCPLCNEDYNNKTHKPVQCKFCGIWNCIQCICPRKRYHPRAKQSNSERYEICYRCDDKFLNLILNHPFYENKCLLEELISRVRTQKEAIEDELIKDDEASMNNEQSINNNKNLISEMKQEKKDMKKDVKQLKNDVKVMMIKNQERSKYLSQLKELKIQQEAEKQRKAQQMKKKQLKITTEVSVGQSQTYEKPKRTLSHNKVLSEAIYQEPVQDAQDEVEEDMNPAAQTIIPSTAVYYPEPEQSNEKKLNFFNYHEWGRNSYDEPKEQNNEEQEQPPVGGLQQESVQQSFTPSPNSTNQIQHTESLTQKKLAQIFAKPEPRPINDDPFDIDEDSALDQEEVQIKKKQLVQAAIRSSQQERKLNEQLEMTANNPQKCACVIY